MERHGSLGVQHVLTVGNAHLLSQDEGRHVRLGAVVDIVTARQVVGNALVGHCPRTDVAVVTSEVRVEDKERSVDAVILSSGIQRSLHLVFRNNLPLGILAVGNILAEHGRRAVVAEEAGDGVDTLGLGLVDAQTHRVGIVHVVALEVVGCTAVAHLRLHLVDAITLIVQRDELSMLHQ